MPSRVVARSLVLVSSLLLFPAAAFAQGAITGVVKDVSGAVLPGVTVEAASPVLIEKVRSVATDASGQYRVVDFRRNLPVVVEVDVTDLGGHGEARRYGQFRVAHLGEVCALATENVFHVLITLGAISAERVNVFLTH